MSCASRRDQLGTEENVGVIGVAALSEVSPPAWAVEVQCASGDRVDDRGKKVVLGLLDACVEGGGVVSGDYGHGRLRKNGARIDALVDKVNSAAADVDAGRERVSGAMRTRKRWKQRGMDVQDAPGESPHEGGSEDTHEAREDYEVGRVGAHALGERDVPGIAVVPAAQRDELRGDAAVSGLSERGSVAVGRHRDDLGGASTVVDRSPQRGEVAASTRDENHESHQSS